MTRPMIIHGYEHKTSFCVLYPEDEKRMKQFIASHPKPERLGLYENHEGFTPGNYIGMVWLDKGDNRTVLRVDSKFPIMDYVAMYAECAAHPIIGERLHCLHVWPDQDLIETRGGEFSDLVVIAYLRELNELCRRHMRRHFLRERQNFIGKMKGKIIIGENLRRNTIHARPDRIYCEYQSVSDDILENQILRTALERAARYSATYRDRKNTLGVLQQWIRASRAALNGVSTRKVKPGDFAVARKRGSFAFYKRPLELAKAVLLKLGPNPQAKDSQTQTPPFALDSAELFERYAEIKFLEDSENFGGLLPGKNIGSPDAGDFNVKVRPDFYVPDKETPHIIDAKYKNLNFSDTETGDNNEESKPPRDDMYQVVAYSQHLGLLEEMKCDDENAIKLGLAYPYIGESEESVISRKQTRAFMSPLIVYGIPCPTKHNEDN